jgi:hypothetical protein
VRSSSIMDRMAVSISEESWLLACTDTGVVLAALALWMYLLFGTCGRPDRRGGGAGEAAGGVAARGVLVGGAQAVGARVGDSISKR